MERVGILLVSYGAREVAMADAFLNSNQYRVELFIADKQRNPFNLKHAAAHELTGLDLEKICEFAAKYRSRIDFGIVGPEDPIIHGIRDRLESKLGIPMICPSSAYALERSKAAQRILLEQVAPEANPSFKIFDPRDYRSKSELIAEVKDWIAQLGGVQHCVIKPDKPGYGKGVAVGGEHFQDLDQALDHFLSILGGPTQEKVIIEAKISGQESSFQAFCDGVRLGVLPETRDYKRAYEGDRGPNTGGMGSYKCAQDWLPFMTQQDYLKEQQLVQRIFLHLRGKTRNPGLLGIPFYVAFIHTGDHPKILEINSRPGDPEIINILPLLETDLVDICFGMLHGNLPKLEWSNLASVVIYKVPPAYPFKSPAPADTSLDLSQAAQLASSYGKWARLYPAAVELRSDGSIHMLSSRTIAAVGIAPELDQARKIALQLIQAVKGQLRYREDIASSQHIQASIDHLTQLRKSQN